MLKWVVRWRHELSALPVNNRARCAPATAVNGAGMGGKGCKDMVHEMVPDDDLIGYPIGYRNPIGKSGTSAPRSTLVPCRGANAIEARSKSTSARPLLRSDRAPHRPDTEDGEREQPQSLDLTELSARARLQEAMEEGSERRDLPRRRSLGRAIRLSAVAAMLALCAAGLAGERPPQICKDMYTAEGGVGVGGNGSCQAQR